MVPELSRGEDYGNRDRIFPELCWPELHHFPSVKRHLPDPGKEMTRKKSEMIGDKDSLRRAMRHNRRLHPRLPGQNRLKDGHNLFYFNVHLQARVIKSEKSVSGYTFKEMVVRTNPG
jgi:hypothetical protein